MERGIQAAADALKLAGEAWGDDQQMVKKILKRDLRRFIKFWILSKQGLQNITFSNEKDKAFYKEWCPLFRHALFALNSAAMCDATMTTEMKTMILLKTLLFTLTEAESDASTFVHMLNYFIYGLFSSPTKMKIHLARYFSKKSKRALVHCNKQVVMSYTIFGRAEIFLNNKPTKGIQAPELFIYLGNGVLDVPNLMKHPYLNDVIREDPAWVMVTMYGPLMCNFLKGDLDAYAEYLDFQGQVLTLVPARSLALIRFHRHLFELLHLL
ncbi:hypothetical protein HDU97_005483 [Phlyctochytrium planicorne]|nr:hypothetical protein HDU97_005483 [Phlyctochytrium planicorne]